jgi:hypothetical protein
MTYEVVPHEQGTALATELGMPPDAGWLRAGIEGAVYGPKLQGYTLEFFGIPHRANWTPPDGPFVFLERLHEGRVQFMNLQAWQTLVMSDGSPLVGEVRWHPARGLTATIRGLELDRRQAAVEAARRGLDLLLGSGILRGGGRPGHYDDASEPRFFELLGKAAHTAVKEGEHANYTTLARWGQIGTRATISTYVEQFGYDLRAIEREALGCTGTPRLHTCDYLWRRRAAFKVKRGV